MDMDTPTLTRTPIRIPKRSIREGHNMGCTLFLIITFNLALAHHLKALKNTYSSSLSSTILLNKIVHLYELANNWQYQSRSDYETDEDGDSSEEEDDTIISMDEDDTNRIYSTRFNMILYNNLTHLNQLMVHNNDSRSKSSKRHLDDLLSNITHVVSDDNENGDDHTEKQRCKRRFVECDLEFEYYNKKEEDEFYNHQEKLRRECYSSTAAPKVNARWGVAEPVFADTSACTVMRTSSSFLRLQNDHRFADVA